MATCVEHAHGRFAGREETRDWVTRTMTSFPGNGLWREEEDVYNPATFASAVKQWLAIAAELGQLPDDLPEWARRA